MEKLTHRWDKFLAQVSKAKKPLSQLELRQSGPGTILSTAVLHILLDSLVEAGAWRSSEDLSCPARCRIMNVKRVPDSVTYFIHSFF